MISAVVLLTMFCWNPATRHHAVPGELSVEARLDGFPEEVRYFPRDPGDIKLMEKEFVDSWLKEKDLLKAQQLPPAYYLALSGGGDKGAFGAGFLNGWAAAGTRPTFKLVTGVSTGALIAPFAFLGADYDKNLRALYTGVSQKDIAAKRFFYSVFLQDGMADTSPLAKLLAAHVTQEMLDAIAAEYAKGRMLFIGTTNLDARRSVVWNVTKIAASHRPEAIDVVRRILLASAAIPGAFPPVMFDVEARGKKYQEMHVDGGATTQVFVYWAGVRLGELARQNGAVRERKIYIIVNARLDPEWGEVERRTLPITFKAIETLLQYQAFGDLYRIYSITQRDGTDFNLAFIPNDFKVVHKEDFDPEFMKELYKFGYNEAMSGYSWMKQPPMQVQPGQASE
ncbi:MAG TPA: patatin-like phospholipase family protein [Verrucomicrobiae bacterium]|nr:patatin-like phospholipase family protein [Verrucomicrobiae bacterium]